jgi:hypothetical protein
VIVVFDLSLLTPVERAVACWLAQRREDLLKGDPRSRTIVTEHEVAHYLASVRADAVQADVCKNMVFAGALKPVLRVGAITDKKSIRKWRIADDVVWMARRLALPNQESETVAAGNDVKLEPSSVSSDMAGDASGYVTLDQAAALVNRNKKTLERHLRNPKSRMPQPEVAGGGGKPHEWRWAVLRPWLEKQFGKTLPERFPAHR